MTSVRSRLIQRLTLSGWVWVVRVAGALSKQRREVEGPRRERFTGDGAETGLGEARLLESPHELGDGVRILRAREPHPPTGRREARGDRASELGARLAT